VRQTRGSEASIDPRGPAETSAASVRYPDEIGIADSQPSPNVII
jgi:hypothetical protein